MTGCRNDTPPATSGDTPERLLIIGQDLGAIRGYMDSNCCPRPAALTAYVDFYDILTEDDFGGLGINATGEPIDLEFDWDAGPVSAYKTATEFGVDSIAIGLSLTENEHPGKLARLVAGDFDDEIHQLAVLFAKIPGQVYLRIGYEFDGAWNKGYEDQQNYIQAYRRIVDSLRSQQTANVQYVWQGSAAVVDDVIDKQHEDIDGWYPGDDYVDWMAFSWFMHADEQTSVEDSYSLPTPRQLADEILKLARAHAKPVMIAEASPQAFDLLRRTSANHSPIWDGPSGENEVSLSNEQIWEGWFAPMFDYLDSNRDVIYAVAYINANWDAQAMWGRPYENGYWGDSRLEVNDEIAARFTAEVAAWQSERDWSE